MGLVEYSDSESDSEVKPSLPPKETSHSQPKTTANKPFQKFVDRSNPGKILVNLPTASSPADTQQGSDEPPTKRARTSAAGGSRFSGFSSFLPPPKTKGNPAALAQTSSSTGKPAPRPGILLKTGAEPSFSREKLSTEDGDWNGNEDYGEDGSTSGTAGDGGGGGSRLKLPPPKKHNNGPGPAGPSIPEGQKAPEDVQLVGKPLMFKPLSVSRKPAKKKGAGSNMAGGGAVLKPGVESTRPSASPAQAEPPKKKISLFSLGDDTSSTPTAPETTSNTGAYEPLFTAEEPDATSGTYDDLYSNTYPTPTYQPTHQPTQPSALSTLADDLNLTPQARRELFGRGGEPSASTAGAKIVNFDMEREYRHNETVRAAGETVTHNPVRSIAPGKHSLRQLVNAVQSNASALEESFASGKNKRGEAAGRYGWR